MRCDLYQNFLLKWSSASDVQSCGLCWRHLCGHIVHQFKYICSQSACGSCCPSAWHISIFGAIVHGLSSHAMQGLPDITTMHHQPSGNPSTLCKPSFPQSPLIKTKVALCFQSRLAVVNLAFQRRKKGRGWRFGSISEAMREMFLAPPGDIKAISKYRPSIAFSGHTRPQ